MRGATEPGTAGLTWIDDFGVTELVDLVDHLAVDRDTVKCFIGDSFVEDALRKLLITQFSIYFMADLCERFKLFFI